MPTCLDTLSVAFFDPVDVHVLADRAIKYGMLFVVFTMAVGLVEVLARRRVHPVQYTPVGFALCLFFLLLLSLSEHVAFDIASMPPRAPPVPACFSPSTAPSCSARAGRARGSVPASRRCAMLYAVAAGAAGAGDRLHRSLRRFGRGDVADAAGRLACALRLAAPAGHPGHAGNSCGAGGASRS
ncbi:MAG: inner membrane CreD family protein [Rubrivivax sp.]